MQKANTLKEYRKELGESLDNDFLRTTLDNFAVAYRAGRANAFKGMDVKGLIDEIACSKDDASDHYDELVAEFQANAEAAGVHVHFAKDADQANAIIAGIAKDTGCKKIVKSKSMTAEETLLNHALEDEGLEVTETDLGEWIIQLRHEGPSHMVMPAIHLSRYQVGDLFTDVTGKKQDSDIDKLVKVARRELRQKYVEADMGITGANFAVAETGGIGLVTNEGNARLVSTLPRVHVALMGRDKVIASLHDALRILRVLPRNATGQQITSYVTWITGANECATGPDGKKEVHYVILDNGRSEMAKDPLFSQVSRCVRCGACANVCPVYRLVGGHKMGHIYIGAIGLILTYFFHGKDKARNLVQNCINCEACKDICAGGIDLPRLIKEIHARIQDEEGHPLPSLLLGKVLRNRKLFHTLLRSAKWAQKPVQKEGFIRHLPMILGKEHGFKALPAIAETPFRDKWPSIRPQVSNPKHKVALFSGCVQDFVYPEQMEAAISLFAAHGVAMDYPMEQSCCGLPVQMMGEKKASRDVAVQNIRAFEAGEFDYVITLCASCAAHLKHNYPKLVADNASLAIKAQQFADKVIDYSSFVHDVLGVKAEDFNASSKIKATYHAPCHLCRGLDVHDAPRELIETSGAEYIECAEEEVCCGFGGTFSMKFPELSSELLRKKLDNVEETGADVLLTDCPGCVMQLRGGLKARGSNVKVRHVAEVLADNKK